MAQPANFDPRQIAKCAGGPIIRRSDEADAFAALVAITQ